MKKFKNFETNDIDFDDFDYDESSENTMNKSELKKHYILFDNSEQSIEIAMKLEILKMTPKYFDRIINNEGDVSWNRFNYTHDKKWCRSTENRGKKTMSHSEFMDIDIID